MIEKVHSAPFMVMVYRVDIIRLRAGPDHLYLRTNLPNPCYPYNGTLSIRLATTRGNGRKWVAEQFPGQPIEVTEADMESISSVARESGTATVASTAPLADGGLTPSDNGHHRPILRLRGSQARKLS